MTDHHPEEDAGQLYTRLVRAVGELGILVDPIRYSTANAHDRDQLDGAEVATKAAEVAELARRIAGPGPDGPRFAKRATINTRTGRLEIDGELFPWLTSQDASIDFGVKELTFLVVRIALEVGATVIDEPEVAPA